MTIEKIMFTAFALTQPYSENCIAKSKKRAQGTLLGELLVFILFSIIKDESIRGIVIVMAGYTSTYMKDYRALLINKFVLHYNVEKGSKYLLDMYDKVNKEIITEGNMYSKIKNNSYKIKKLLLIPVLIEEKLLKMNEMYKDHNQGHFIKKQKYLTNNLYSLYINIKENKIKDNNVEKILKDIDYIFKYEKHQKSKDRILEEIYYSEDLKNKIVYKNLLYSLNVLNKKNEKILV